MLGVRVSVRVRVEMPKVRYAWRRKGPNEMSGSPTIEHEYNVVILWYVSIVQVSRTLTVQPMGTLTVRLSEHLVIESLC